MKLRTRQLFGAFVSKIALLNSLPAMAAPDAGTVKFNVDPNVEQKLESRLEETNEFLQMINMIGVSEQEGAVLGVGVDGSIAGRQDTSGGNRRNPQAMGNPDEKHRYLCRKTNYDWSQPYALIDAWAHKPDFQTILRDSILRRQARDRILIGFNGTSAAANTDRAANPLLQDVNEGWLHKLRTDAPAQVMSDGALTVHSDGSDDDALDAIYVKAGVDLYDAEVADSELNAAADYSSLDALVLDAKRGIHEAHRGDTDLVVIVGHDLLDDKYFNIAQQTGNTATEQEATDRILASTKMIGGLRAYRVSGFPANAVLITKMSNLSIYWQEGSRRRQLKDEPEYDRIANYESVNEAYVIEEYELAVLVENIVMGEASARPAP
ncbi:phage major capsid protein, P2 family [Erythrobacter sp. EC-HK427]|uniref:phage major capsid protein, P2 family n=1 Tax=Erythrobacter sp. EC-HK427 TaxID=2038396 RepID=UPI00125A4E1C|nr:phage major capsid protein, P2 family [Erythrobacter sp. EC-HK427]VVT07479.1 Phage major capsid protein [Erythrobacter sp. EC-HK427]